MQLQPIEEKIFGLLLSLGFLILVVVKCQLFEHFGLELGKLDLFLDVVLKYKHFSVSGYKHIYHLFIIMYLIIARVFGAAALAATYNTIVQLVIIRIVFKERLFFFFFLFGGLFSG